MFPSSYVWEEETERRRERGRERKRETGGKIIKEREEERAAMSIVAR